MTAAVLIGLLAAACGAGGASEGSSEPSVEPSIGAPPASVEGPGAVRPPGCVDAELHFEPALGMLLLANCVDQMDHSSVEQIWGWDGTAWVLVDADGPPALVVPGIAYDAGRRTLIRYGGLPLDSNDCTSGTWEWNGTDWTEVDAAPPDVCDHMKLVYDANMGATLLFGGQDADRNPSPDTWAWDGSTWQRVASEGPPFRAHFELVHDADHAQTFLWGGYDGDRVFDDFWSWDGSTWTQLAFDGPTARSHASMAVTPDGLLLFGGATTTSSFGSLTDETWYLTDGRWSLLEGSAPSPRGMAAVGFDPDRGVIVLYGGFDATGESLADTWEWDGAWRCVDRCDAAS